MKREEGLTVAKFITQAIKHSGRSQIEIAEFCGWPKPNIVTMIKQGKTKLPLDKVGQLATILGVQPVYLLWLTLREYMPETLLAIESSIRGVMLTEHERVLIEAYRDLTHGLDADTEIHVQGDSVRVTVDGVKTYLRAVPRRGTSSVGLVA